jgi:hypothetical protein
MSLTWEKASSQKAAEEKKNSDDTDVTRLQFGLSGAVPALEKKKTKTIKREEKPRIPTPHGSMKNLKKMFKKRGTPSTPLSKCRIIVVMRIAKNQDFELQKCTPEEWGQGVTCSCSAPPFSASYG